MGFERAIPICCELNISMRLPVTSSAISCCKYLIAARLVVWFWFAAAFRTYPKRIPHIMTDVTVVWRVWSWHHLLPWHKASKSLASFGFFWSRFFLLLSLLQVGSGELWECQKRLNFVSISKDLLNHDWSIVTTTIFTPMTDRGTRLGLGLFHRTVHCIVTLRCAHSFCLWSLLLIEPIVNNHVKPKFIHAISSDTWLSDIHQILSTSIQTLTSHERICVLMACSMSPRTRKRGPFSCNHSPSLRRNGVRVFIWIKCEIYI